MNIPVGVEIELFVFKDGSPISSDFRDSLIREANITVDKKKIGKIDMLKEYYDNMIEIRFLYPETSAKDVLSLLAIFRNHDCTYEWESSYNGACYNGCHIHTIIEPVIRKDLISNIVDNINLSERFITSHHIWGGYGRDVARFDSAWRKKARFLPYTINPTRPDKVETYEIRAFNMDSLSELMKLINSIYISVNTIGTSDARDYIPLDDKFFLVARNAILKNGKLKEEDFYEETNIG